MLNRRIDAKICKTTVCSIHVLIGVFEDSEHTKLLMFRV